MTVDSRFFTTSQAKFRAKLAAPACVGLAEQEISGNHQVTGNLDQRFNLQMSASQRSNCQILWPEVKSGGVFLEGSVDENLSLDDVCDLFVASEPSPFL